MWFLTYISANLIGRPARSLLTLTGIAVAVGAVVALLGIVHGFERSLLDLYEKNGVDLLVLQAGRVQATASELPESLGDRIKAVAGVEQVAPLLTEVLSLITDDLLGITVQGWRADAPSVKDLPLVSGRKFTSADRRKILIGAGLAKAAKKQVGDPIEILEGEVFEVVGVFQSFNVFENGSIIVRLDELQEITLRQGEVTLFAVVTSNQDPAFLANVQQSIRSLNPGLEVTPARELAENSNEIRAARSFAWLTSAIALLVGSIGMLNTMMMAVFERTKEIAMLRALGWRRRRIVGMILGESLLLSCVGALLGICGAIWLVHWLSQLPASGRMVSGVVHPSVVLRGFLMAIALGLLGGVLPSIKAARLLPIEGLRHD